MVSVYSKHVTCWKGSVQRHNTYLVIVSHYLIWLTSVSFDCKYCHHGSLRRRLCPCFPSNLEWGYSSLIRQEIVGLYNAKTGFPLSLSHVFAKVEWYIAWHKTWRVFICQARRAVRQTMFRVYVWGPSETTVERLLTGAFLMLMSWSPSLSVTPLR